MRLTRRMKSQTPLTTDENDIEDKTLKMKLNSIWSRINTAHLISVVSIPLFVYLIGTGLYSIVSRTLDYTADVETSDEMFHSPMALKLEYLDMEKNLKIFIYPGDDDNTVCREPRKLEGKYASEGFFFKNIRESQFLTHDPEEAHFFFIPISCHSLRGQGRSYRNITATVKKFVDRLISKYPYWNRTLGADHFFLTCHDIGLNATKGLKLLEKNSIRVVCSPTYDAEYYPHKDVSLPHVIQPFALPAGGNNAEERKVLAFWAGRRSPGIRTMLIETWGNDTDLHIQSNRVDLKKAKGNLKFQEKFYESKFCICPGGSTVHGARIADAIHYGCVPVILSDYYDLPFNDILDWRKFSVILTENDVYHLKKILTSIPDKRYRALQSTTVKVQKHFRWNEIAVRFDAFHMVMYELWLRRHVVKYGDAGYSA